MKIYVIWDSNAFPMYIKATGLLARELYEEIVEVPDGVYERYDKAHDELEAAGCALDKAVESARRSAKDTPNDVN